MGFLGLRRIEARAVARDLVVTGLAFVPFLLAVDRGQLALPALALGLVDLLLHRRRGLRLTPRLMAARHALLGPIGILALALADARGEAVLCAVSSSMLCITARATLRSSLPLLAGGALLALTVRPSLEPRHDAGTLRVATYNLRGFASDATRLAETMRSLRADVIAIQELSDNFEGRPFDLQGYLARNLRMRSTSALLLHADHGDFGVGILSKYPILSAERLRLPYVPRSGNPRDVLKVRLDVGGTCVTVVSAHLDRLPYGTIGDNSAQVAAIAEWIAGEPVVVLCGDFNAFPVFPGHGLLESTMLDARMSQRWPSGTWPSPLGLIRMDWIFARGLAPRSQRVVRTGPSDHFPVVADLEIPPGTASR